MVENINATGESLRNLFFYQYDHGKYLGIGGFNNFVPNSDVIIHDFVTINNKEFSYWERETPNGSYKMLFLYEGLIYFILPDESWLVNYSPDLQEWDRVKDGIRK